MVSHKRPKGASGAPAKPLETHPILAFPSAEGGEGREAMALFIDTFVNKVDRKGRVSVPATFRAALAGQTFNGIAALPAFRYAGVQCGSIEWMQGLIDRLQNSDLYSDEHDDFTASLFPDAKQLAFDGEGRIMLPEKFAEHAGITAVAAFVGRGNLFEIWEPRTFEAYKAEARRRALEQGRTLPPRGGDSR